MRQGGESGLDADPAAAPGDRLPGSSPTLDWTQPLRPMRPGRWGAGDERGSANHMSPKSVLRAASLIRTGETFDLSHMLNEAMPVSDGRSWRMYPKPPKALRGENRRGGNEELVVAEIGQVGTHLDGFGHQTHDGCFYNGFTCDEVQSREGLKKLGIEKVGPLITRGVLLDVAAARGVDCLPAGYEVTVADLELALSLSRLSLEPGDAVLLRYGWERHWGVDNATYRANAPGIVIAAATWLIERDPMLIGADNATVEVAVNPDSHLSLPVHQIALVANGVLLMENLKLSGIAAAGLGEFAFIAQPLRIEGASGSTVAPVAVR